MSIANFEQQTASETLQVIDRLVEKYHLLKHPFYQAWTAGELSMNALKDYATQYYHHVAAFPTYLSAVHAQTEDIETRRAILQNLMDEEAGSPNHPELWLAFVEALGLDPVQARNADQWPETKNLIAAFRAACRDHGTAAGLAALYAYESQIPSVSTSKIEGLQAHYGFEDPRGYRYFSVHIEADREHSRAERDLLMRLLDQADSEAIIGSANHVLASLWDLLSGVCRRHGITCQN